MKQTLIIFLCLLSISAFGYAPMLDKFISFREWILPAYVYCFWFVIITLIGVIAISYLHKEKINNFFIGFNRYLKTHSFTSIYIIGFLLAIPLGLISGVMYSCFWFSAYVLIFPLMIIFLIILSFRNLRNKIFNRHTLKFLTFITIAALLSSLFFIISKYIGLPQTDKEYLAWGRSYIRLYYHPFDSLKYIWEFVPYFILLIPLTYFFVFIGKITLKLRVISFHKEEKLRMGD